MGAQEGSATRRIENRPKDSGLFIEFAVDPQEPPRRACLYR
jgi:hypothetical protein